MKIRLITFFRAIAFCGLLFAILSTSARAQRVEPEVREVDASVQARIDQRRHEDAPAKKLSQASPHSQWSSPSTQADRNLVRAGNATPSPASSANSTQKSSKAPASPARSPSTPPHTSVSAYGLPSNDGRIGNLHPSVSDEVAPLQSHRHRSRKKAPVNQEKEKIL
jgi:uncharacterized membrane protein